MFRFFEMFRSFRFGWAWADFSCTSSRCKLAEIENEIEGEARLLKKTFASLFFLFSVSIIHDDGTHTHTHAGRDKRHSFFFKSTLLHWHFLYFDFVAFFRRNSFNSCRFYLKFYFFDAARKRTRKCLTFDRKNRESDEWTGETESER